LSDLVSQNGRPITLAELRGTAGAAKVAKIPSIHQDAIDYVQGVGKARGREAALVYNADGAEVVRRVGTTRGVAFDKSDYDLMKGGTLVHNHPNLAENSLSIQDFNAAARTGMKEIVAVSTGGTQYIGSAEKALGKSVYNVIEGRIRGELSPLIKAGSMTPDDANMIHFHIVNSALAKRGSVQYRVETPSDLFKSLTENHADIISRILATFKEKT
jgi:hypothetical protein